MSRNPVPTKAEKKCAKCRTTKPVSEFYFHSSNADRLGSYCRDCTRDVRRASKRKRSAAYFESHASFADVIHYANSLGFTLGKGGVASPAGQALIKRYNRDHPERQYVPQADRQ